MEDKDEFQTMFPKFGHRLHWKAFEARCEKPRRLSTRARSDYKTRDQEKTVIASDIAEQPQNVVELEEIAVSLFQTDVR